MLEEVSELLIEHNINHEIKGRSKSIYSIYNKLDKGKKLLYEAIDKKKDPKELIKKNSKKCNIEQIDFDALSKEEASKIIDEIFAKTE